MLDQKTSFPFNSAVTNVGKGVLLVFGAAALPVPCSDCFPEAMQPLSHQVRPWEYNHMYPGVETGESAQELETVLGEFASRIAGEIVDPAPEIDAFITEHFWDLV